MEASTRYATLATLAFGNHPCQGNQTRVSVSCHLQTLSLHSSRPCSRQAAPTRGLWIEGKLAHFADTSRTYLASAQFQHINIRSHMCCGKQTTYSKQRQPAENSLEGLSL
jgi:hypothetical protein